MIGQIEDKHNKLAKQTSIIQQKLTQIEDCLRIKLENGDLDPIREAMELFATKKSLVELTQVTDGRIQDVVNTIETFRQEMEN
jgi:hypothetical protein